ncbi:MAG: 1-acyl-sn-glycerol-3-phosphate acyltransferase [Chloroflexi bacterium]|nr:1-acyl-sn-glycerol-3-phosphate acyltransferase [Chloroflexota bacterium]
MSALIYYFLRSLAVILARFLVRLQVEGGENVPRKGPAILVVNHVDIVDPPILVISTRRHIFFMAKEELFRVPVFGGLMRKAGTISVKRKSVDRQALRQALNVLKGGGVLGLFPEGTRNAAATLQRAHTGATMLALRSGVPVLPVALVGTGKVFEEKGRFLPRRVPVKVVFGPAFHLPQREKEGKEDLTELTDFMMGRLAVLLPPDLRGVYAGAVDQPSRRGSPGDLVVSVKEG